MNFLRLCFGSIIVSLIWLPPAHGQASADYIDSCLKAFDAKARQKKLSPDLYASAIKGACLTEEGQARAYVSIDAAMMADPDWHMQFFERSIANMSIGVQTGPPIGAQKGPPFTMAQG